MARSLLKRLKAIAVLAMLVCPALTASEDGYHEPGFVTSYTFRQLEENSPVFMELATSDEELLLIRVEGHETAFSSSLQNADGHLLSSVRLPYLRAGPVFHVIELPQANGPLRISITPEHVTRNSRIRVRVYSLSGATRVDASRLQAIRNYGLAVQSTRDESAGIWLDRVELLRLAASGFEQSRDVEMQLWAEYLAAYFHYFPLADYQSATRLAMETRQKAGANQQALIELMALQLEGQVLIERDRKDSPAVAEGKIRRAQEMLQLAELKAGELDMHFERAWAINTQGIGYFYLDNFSGAEEQYQRALDIAIDLDDGYLQRLLRGNLALVHERKGDLGDALAELMVLNYQMQDSASKADLAHSWSEQGRLLQKLHLFPQAVEALSRSLELSKEINSAEGIARTSSSLAHAYHGMGYMERATSTMEFAIEKMKAANFARGLREGYRLLADIHRLQGNFPEMAEARAMQEQYLTADLAQAHYHFSLGLDALARPPSNLKGADRFFARAEKLLVAGESEDLHLRIRFQRCLLAPSLEDSSQNCDASELKHRLTDWLPMATPAQALETRFLMARILIRQGSVQAAISAFENLIDDIQRYRNDLPGVLGAWYWESRAQIFQTYLKLVLHRMVSPEQGPESLLALNRIRNSSMVSEFDVTRGNEPAGIDIATRELRSLLARLDSEETESGRLTLRQAIDQKLLELSSGGRALDSQLDRKGLEQALASMPDDSALLSYYFSNDVVWAWIADSTGVRTFELGHSPGATGLLRNAREGLRIIGHNRLDDDLEAVGQVLLKPLLDQLPAKIYLLAAGELAGFPFEAIRIGGHYFGEDHQVINLMTVRGLDDTENRADVSAWNKVFLAGFMGDRSTDRARLPGAETELNDIQNIFKGIEIKEHSSVDSENALTNLPAYAESNLLHFASHGEINLEYPELSKLLLSGDSAEEFLTPLDVRQSSVAADLVVLSACETTGVNTFTFDSNLGFVSEFLQSGSGAVVASLWPVGDSFTQAFMKDFYSRLVQNVSAGDALAATKRSHLAAAHSSGNLDWSSFQIYIR